MKCALLISGDYREFELAIQSWEFLGYLDCDVYMSCCKSSVMSHPIYGIFDKGEINLNRIRRIINPRAIFISSEKTHIPNVVHMMSHWKNCIQLMINSKEKYDAVIIIRPDLFVELRKDIFLEEISRLKNNIIYIIGHTKKNTTTVGLQDQLLIGTQDTMKKLLDIRTETYKRGVDIHRWLYNEFSAIFDDYVDLSKMLRYCIVRPTVAYDDISNFEKVQEKAIIWWEMRNQMGVPKSSTF